MAGNKKLESFICNFFHTQIKLNLSIKNVYLEIIKCEQKHRTKKKNVTCLLQTEIYTFLMHKTKYIQTFFYEQNLSLF